MPHNPLEQMNQALKEAILEAIAAAGLAQPEEIPAIVLEVPKDKAHGDFATNAAMQLTRIAKKNPRQIAEEILAKLDYSKAGIEKAEIAGPGFINFTLGKGYLYPILLEVYRAGKTTAASSKAMGKRPRSNSSAPIRRAACIWAMRAARRSATRFATCWISPDTR